MLRIQPSNSHWFHASKVRETYARKVREVRTSEARSTHFRMRTAIAHLFAHQQKPRRLPGCCYFAVEPCLPALSLTVMLPLSGTKELRGVVAVTVKGGAVAVHRVIFDADVAAFGFRGRRRHGAAGCAR